MKSVVILSIFLFGFTLSAQDISITVTQENLALVQETRSFSLKKGINSILIENLPAQIDQSSVNFSFKDQSISLREYSYAYDLQSTQMMLEKSLGKTIRLIDADHGTVLGKLIAVQSTSLVLQSTDGELRVITNYNNAHIIFDKSDLYTDLVSNPTIFCSLESSLNGNADTRITYATLGMDWSTEYTAIIDDTEKQLSLLTQAIISNFSGKNYKDCKLLLIAGEINRPPTPRRSVAGVGLQTMNDMISTAAESDFEESTSFEYHSYRLDRNINLKNQQQKVLALYPETEIDISKKFTYNHQKDPTGISIIISAINSKKNGFGKPLPAGRVRVLKKDQNGLLILGEDNISHIPVEEEIKLNIGQAFDVVAQRQILERNREGKNSEKMKISINFRNRKKEDIEIHVTEPIARRGNFRILSSNIKVHKKSANKVEFIVPLKTNQSNILEYEILYNW